MEIEVGEYVRTDKGIIYKFTQRIKKDIQLQDFINCNDGRMLKHSKNIIDLIEVGDYVNGHKIVMDLQASKKHYNTENNFITAIGYTFEENEIKTILTHEQYELNCFRLEDNI